MIQPRVNKKSDGRLTSESPVKDGERVLDWIRDNRHTLTWVAERLGYARQTLSQSLHRNHISPRLAEALFEHFGLRVRSTDETPKPAEGGRDATKGADRKPARSRGRRGRPPGIGRGPGVSKLDPHQDKITHLLDHGATQKFIASRYGTSESTLHNWMKKRGLKRRRTDN